MGLDYNAPVLVVDDYKTMVKIVRHLLTQIGFTNIDDASNGAEALQKLQARAYGLVISDWNMEPMTGYELLQRTRSDTANPSVPFIMVTAESRPENIAAAQAAGVDGYLIKPFNQHTLKASINQVSSSAAVAA